MFRSYKKTLGLLAFMSASGIAMGQNTASNTSEDFIMLLVMSALVVAIACLLIVVGVFIYLKSSAAKEEIPESEKKLSFWQRFDRKYITSAIPVEMEKDIDLQHDYDGIRELDNDLPPWWLALFYGCIIWGIGYFFYYSGTSSWSQHKQYQEEMAEADEEIKAYKASLAESGGGIDENNVVWLSDAGSLNAGKIIYDEKCASCHITDGGGGIGPNLTDKYWIHGGSIADVFSTIRDGVLEKGMLAWGDQLSQTELQEVSSYVKTFAGKTSAKPKAAEGELYEEPIAPAAVEGDSMEEGAAEETAKLMGDAAAGKLIYDEKCAVCHLPDGGGSVGPNFTDQYWIHGGSFGDVVELIKKGVIEKGMVPWEETLSPEEINNVAAYILEFQGTTPATPKDAEGELYEAK